MNKKQKIINRINEKKENWYRSATKEYLTRCSTFNNFEISIFSEIIYTMIEKRYPLELCFEQISEEYDVDCKRIAFFALMPIKFHKKVYYFQNIEKTINYFFEVVKRYVVRETFNGNLKI